MALGLTGALASVLSTQDVLVCRNNCAGEVLEGRVSRPEREPVPDLKPDMTPYRVHASERRAPAFGRLKSPCRRISATAAPGHIPSSPRGGRCRGGGG